MADKGSVFVQGYITHTTEIDGANESKKELVCIVNDGVTKHKLILTESEVYQLIQFLRQAYDGMIGTAQDND